MLAVVNNGSCVGPQNKIGHPAGRYKQLMQVPMLSASGILINPEIRVIVFQSLHFEILNKIIFTFRERLVRSVKYEVCCVVLVS